MNYEIKQEDKFKFIEEGEGEPLILLHGLFGALSNFDELIAYFRPHNKVVVPMLPLLDLDLLHTSVGGLQKFVHRFIEYMDYQNVNLWVTPWEACRYPARIEAAGKDPLPDLNRKLGPF